MSVGSQPFLLQLFNRSISIWQWRIVDMLDPFARSHRVSRVACCASPVLTSKIIIDSYYFPEQQWKPMSPRGVNARKLPWNARHSNVGWCIESARKPGRIFFLYFATTTMTLPVPNSDVSSWGWRPGNWREILTHFLLAFIATGILWHFESVIFNENWISSTILSKNNDHFQTKQTRNRKWRCWLWFDLYIWPMKWSFIGSFWTIVDSIFSALYVW